MISLSLGMEDVSTDNWNILNLIICLMPVLWYVIVAERILIIAFCCSRVAIFVFLLVFKNRRLEEKKRNICFYKSWYKSFEVALSYQFQKSQSAAYNKL